MDKYYWDKLKKDKKKYKRHLKEAKWRRNNPQYHKKWKKKNAEYYSKYEWYWYMRKEDGKIRLYSGGRYDH